MATVGREDNNGSDREIAEGLASVRWINNDEMAEVSSATSRRTGRCTPTLQRIHVVTGGPERRDITDDAGDSDVDMNTDQQREVVTHRPEVSANRNIAMNQQLGAPSGSGALNIGPTTSNSTPRRPPPLSPLNINRQQIGTTDLYPTLTPLQQSQLGPLPRLTGEREGRRPLDVSELAFLDDDFQECWWAQEQDGSEVLVLVWATRQVDRAVMYAAGGGLWTGTVRDYEAHYPWLAEEARVKREAGQLMLSRHVEVARKGAANFLRQYRRETGGLPSRSTWSNAWKGEIDSGGRQLVANLRCHVCGRERTLHLSDADSIPTIFQEYGFSCSMLQGVNCGMVLPTRGTVQTLLSVNAGGEPVTTPSGSGRRREEVKAESPRARGMAESDNDVEITGFSTAAKQFYKARGPQI